MALARNMPPKAVFAFDISDSLVARRREERFTGLKAILLAAAIAITIAGGWGGAEAASQLSPAPPLEVWLLLDSSPSAEHLKNSTGERYIQVAARELVKRLYLYSQWFGADVSVGAVNFGGEVGDRKPPSKLTDSWTDVIAAPESINYTDFSPVLQIMNQTLLEQAPGKDARVIIVLITDGIPAFPGAVKPSVELTREYFSGTPPSGELNIKSQIRAIEERGALVAALVVGGKDGTRTAWKEILDRRAFIVSPGDDHIRDAAVEIVQDLTSQSANAAIEAAGAAAAGELSGRGIDPQRALPDTTEVGQGEVYRKNFKYVGFLVLLGAALGVVFWFLRPTSSVRVKYREWGGLALLLLRPQTRQVILEGDLDWYQFLERWPLLGQLAIRLYLRDLLSRRDYVSFLKNATKATAVDQGTLGRHVASLFFTSYLEEFHGGASEALALASMIGYAPLLSYLKSDNEKVATTSPPDLWQQISWSRRWLDQIQGEDSALGDPRDLQHHISRCLTWHRKRLKEGKAKSEADAAILEFYRFLLSVVTNGRNGDVLTADEVADRLVAAVGDKDVESPHEVAFSYVVADLATILKSAGPIFDKERKSYIVRQEGTVGPRLTDWRVGGWVDPFSHLKVDLLMVVSSRSQVRKGAQPIELYVATPNLPRIVDEWVTIRSVLALQPVLDHNIVQVDWVLESSESSLPKMKYSEKFSNLLSRREDSCVMFKVRSSEASLVATPTITSRGSRKILCEPRKFNVTFGAPVARSAPASSLEEAVGYSLERLRAARRKSRVLWVVDHTVAGQLAREVDKERELRECLAGAEIINLGRDSPVGDIVRGLRGKQRRVVIEVASLSDLRFAEALGRSAGREVNHMNLLGILEGWIPGHTFDCSALDYLGWHVKAIGSFVLKEVVRRVREDFTPYVSSGVVAQLLAERRESFLREKWRGVKPREEKDLLRGLSRLLSDSFKGASKAQIDGEDVIRESEGLAPSAILAEVDGVDIRSLEEAIVSLVNQDWLANQASRINFLTPLHRDFVIEECKRERLAPTRQ